MSLPSQLRVLAENDQENVIPDMHQTYKENQWCFGIKLHIGVDDQLELIHSIDTTAANQHDIASADKLLHSKDA
ncbi:transposase [Halomonas huangheensis]|uniref:Transposase IS4-like domain-containing protein n=1 Tax=Halomonas huangheensis TaxID=1178482 RepID=W1NDB3_9GAMM|nr:transposase [Halomonas huangheensis]ERL53366.1 hypothetical protein BJB45_07925 [Halomonas huangheensis]